MARTITVKGRAVVKSPAVMTVVRASVEGVAPTFSKALDAVSESTALFKDAAEDAGMDSVYIHTAQSPNPPAPLPSGCREIHRITDLLNL